MGQYEKNDIRMTPASSSDHEEEALVPLNRRVSLQTAVKLRKGVIAVSVISVVVLFILGMVTLVGAILERSSAAFAFALAAFLDALSSSVVLWRFSGNGGTLYSQRRECIACLVLGCFFLLSSILIMVKSVISFVNVVLPASSLFLWWGTLVNLTVCSILVVFKVYLSYKLESRALLTDAFNTIAGAILALSTIIGEVVYKNNNDIWEIDGSIGIICSIALFGYGTWILYESITNLRGEKNQTPDESSSSEN